MGPESRVEQFLDLYEQALFEQIGRGHRSPVTKGNLRQAVHEMRMALVSGKFAVDRVPVVKTCIRLGIKPSRKAIAAFLNGE